MNSRFFDSCHLDVLPFAQQQGHLEGELPLASMTRLMGFCASEPLPSTRVGARWQAQGQVVQLQGRKHPTLSLQAQASLVMTCQRCLAPVSVDVVVNRRFRFVAGDDAAAEEDVDSEDDVLALSAALNLFDLIEDELVLALPWVPRHEVCPHPLSWPAQDQAEVDDPPHPFAALVHLKKPSDQ